MRNSKNVSRERVIGISFVDILIQAVFVLLLAIIVGYVDPVERLNLEEYKEVGKDLCHKLNKDSVEACREFIKINTITSVSDKNYQAIGSQACAKLGQKNPEACTNALSKILSNQSLSPCIKSNTGIKSPLSTSWVIHSPGVISFVGFSGAYKSYLNEKKDTVRLSKIEELRDLEGKHFSPDDLIKRFAFIQEAGCFHEIGLTRVGAFSDADLKDDIQKIYSLKKFKGD